MKNNLNKRNKRTMKSYILRNLAIVTARLPLNLKIHSFNLIVDGRYSIVALHIAKSGEGHITKEEEYWF